MRQVIVYPGESGFYLVECPSLPGCISQGETKEEALVNIKEAIQVYTEALEDQGLPLPVEALSKALGVKPSQLLDDSNETEQNEIELTGIDTRSIKKLKEILSLSAEDRNDLYRILNKMLRKNQLEKKEIDANK